MRERFGGGRTGRVIAALAVDTRVRSSTQVWEQGAVGEAKVGRHLNEFAGPNVVVLHDRRIPGSRANIDHLVVTPGGVPGRLSASSRSLRDGAPGPVA